MATLLLTAGASVLTAGSAAWVTTLATAAATVAGSYIDARLFGPGPQKQEGPRLDNLQVQASTEGAPLPEIAGRVRLSGQLIWATRFKEVARTESSGGGKGGGGGTVETTTYTYYANFAVGLCEGPIDRVGRIWADGKQLDMTGVTMRVHNGTADQAPDPLIEGIEEPAMRRPTVARRMSCSTICRSPRLATVCRSSPSRCSGVCLPRMGPALRTAFKPSR